MLRVISKTECFTETWNNVALFIYCTHIYCFVSYFDKDNRLSLSYLQQQRPWTFYIKIPMKMWCYDCNDWLTQCVSLRQNFVSFLSSSVLCLEIIFYTLFAISYCLIISAFDTLAWMYSVEDEWNIIYVSLLISYYSLICRIIIPRSY